MQLLERAKAYLNTPVDSTGLALFRIVYGLTLLADVSQFYYFRHLIFDPIAYQFPGETEFGLAMLCWIGAIICIVIGWHTRVAAIVNYVMLLAFFATIGSYEYHMMYVDMAMGFLLLFLPVERRLSRDNLRLRLQAPGNELPQDYFKVPRWCYTVPVFLAIAMVYTDSIFYKYSSNFWPSGLGMWFPASMPQINHSHWMQPLLNQEWLMLSLGYLTLAFETLFIFVMWSKRARPFLFVIGVGLHLGIVVAFPIPWFGLGYLGIYLLVLPSTVWKRIGDAWRRRSGRIQGTYDPDDDEQLRAKAWVDGLDFLQIVDWSEQDGGDANKVLGLIRQLPVHKWGAAVLNLSMFQNFALKRRPRVEREHRNPVLSGKVIVFAGLLFLVMQLNATSFTPAGLKLRNMTGLSQSKSFVTASQDLVWTSRSLFGITPHPVFMDFHFRGYNHVIAVVYVDRAGKETWLPIANRDGSPSWYIYSFNWVKWTFRVNGPNINQWQLDRGIRNFTAFWAKRNGVSLNDATFQIRVKKVRVPGKFERDFLTTESQKPWQSAGEVSWKNGNYNSRIANIEAI